MRCFPSVNHSLHNDRRLFNVLANEGVWWKIGTGRQKSQDACYRHLLKHDSHYTIRKQYIVICAGGHGKMKSKMGDAVVTVPAGVTASAESLRLRLTGY